MDKPNTVSVQISEAILPRPRGFARPHGPGACAQTRHSAKRPTSGLLATDVLTSKDTAEVAVPTVEWEALALASGYSAHRLANRFGISTRQLQRVFQSEFHTTPQVWLERCRLFRAWQMLHVSSSVKEVAYELGFLRLSHFSRKFKAQFGCSPSSILANRHGQLRSNDVA